MEKSLLFSMGNQVLYSDWCKRPGRVENNRSNCLSTSPLRLIEEEMSRPKGLLKIALPQPCSRASGPCSPGTVRGSCREIHFPSQAERSSQITARYKRSIMYLIPPSYKEELRTFPPLGNIDIK
jgi:hypothetical protein